MQKIFFNWSSGKDSALALYYLQQDERVSVQYLLTSVNARYDRVSMHGLRRALLEKQFEVMGIEHGTIELPEQPTNSVYEQKLLEKATELHQLGFTYAAFGDIFLEDLRIYREHLFQRAGVSCLFPIWKRDTKKMISEFLRLGFKAITVCVNGKLLDRSFAGRVIDATFLDQLPEGVDPCGENGEFHTFCFDGPIFARPIQFEVGEIVQREYQDGNHTHLFWFCDLIPA